MILKARTPWPVTIQILSSLVNQFYTSLLSSKNMCIKLVRIRSIHPTNPSQPTKENLCFFNVSVFSFIKSFYIFLRKHLCDKNHNFYRYARICRQCTITTVHFFCITFV